MVMTSLDKNNNNLVVRENLVKTAVKFLQNPRVSGSPLDKKQEFLRKKGLTDEEIKKACELSAIESNQNTLPDINKFTTITIPENQSLLYYHSNPYQLTFYHKIKEIFNLSAFIGATIYCIYWFYKKFIKPLIHGPEKRIDINDSVSELDKSIKTSMKEVKDSIQKVNRDVQKLSHNQIPDPSISQLVQDLKQDLSSLKSLLLSRKQFPSAPASIPSWQLDPTNSSQEKTAEHEDDAGSGSSANNSDSSLEMIREDPPKFDLCTSAVNPP